MYPILFFLFVLPHFRRSALLHYDRNQGKHNMFPFYHPFLPVLHAFRRPVLFISCTLCAPFAPPPRPSFYASFSIFMSSRTHSASFPSSSRTTRARFFQSAPWCVRDPLASDSPRGDSSSPRGARHPTHPSRLYRNDNRKRRQQ